MEAKRWIANPISREGEVLAVNANVKGAGFEVVLAKDYDALRAEVERLTEAQDGAMRQDRDYLLAKVERLRAALASVLDELGDGDTPYAGFPGNHLMYQANPDVLKAARQALNGASDPTDGSR